MPAASPVAATMNVDPTPMNAIWATTRSGRNGGRKAYATTSPAKRTIRPKSSSAACTDRSMAGDCRTEARRARVSCPPRARPESAAHRGDAEAILRAPMVKVGGEVDAFCTKCELTLAHTVHAVVASAPVKVECNTCHGVHRFRAPNGAPSRGSAGRGERPARVRPEVVPFDALLAAKRVDAAGPYSAKRRYAVDDVLDHPSFGRGFVSAVRDGGKIEVTFRSDVKVL